jgi:hypothetical protein
MYPFLDASDAARFTIAFTECEAHYGCKHRIEHPRAQRAYDQRASPTNRVVGNDAVR